MEYEAIYQGTWSQFSRQILGQTQLAGSGANLKGSDTIDEAKRVWSQHRDDIPVVVILNDEQ